MRDTRETVSVKADKYIDYAKYMLSRMPSLENKTLEEIDSDIWIQALRDYKRSNRRHRTWDDLLNYRGYQVLRSVLVLNKNNYTCVYCRRASSSGLPMYVDHKEAKVLGGGEELENLQCTCMQCNQA
ncbi:MAG: HNH endonuclease [Methanomassiliicoccales archaeon]|nr:HNH endonuclease [Methanomassiliicoccales archaeon]